MLQINKAFKMIMVSKGISAVRMAKDMGVSRNTIFVAIGEKANPKLSTLQKYADYLGVKVSDVILMAESIK